MLNSTASFSFPQRLQPLLATVGSTTRGLARCREHQPTKNERRLSDTETVPQRFVLSERGSQLKCLVYLGSSRGAAVLALPKESILVALGLVKFRRRLDLQHSNYDDCRFSRVPDLHCDIAKHSLLEHPICMEQIYNNLSSKMRN